MVNIVDSYSESNGDGYLQYYYNSTVTYTYTYTYNYT
jgi:hypothetical protein